MRTYWLLLLPWLAACSVLIELPGKSPGEDTDVDTPEDTAGDSTADVTDPSDPSDSEEPDVEDPCSSSPAWYRDADNDTYGTASDFVCEETQPSGYVSRSGDCCDTNAQVKPNQTGWFSEPYVCPSAESFDYNCSGEEEQRWTDVIVVADIPR